MSDIYLEEYTADAALPRYRSKTAGHGISHLLDHDYGRIYRQVLEEFLPKDFRRKGVRLLEFGCGAGMNLIQVASLVERLGIRLDRAYGTDFSNRLIDAASADAESNLRRETVAKVKFLVAKNEAIIDDMAAALNVERDSLVGSFSFVFGVNTFRYCHRINRENESAKQLFDLLDTGGVCVVIDMNAQFPLFRSQMRAQKKTQDKEFYIPVLEEYVRPFVSAGFEVLVARNFCWIPHSAGPALTAICRILTPALDAVAPRYAMRSLVIARKPV